MFLDYSFCILPYNDGPSEIVPIIQLIGLKMTINQLIGILREICFQLSLIIAVQVLLFFYRSDWSDRNL